MIKKERNEEKKMETMTGREALKKAFANLRKAGYFARMNFMCCTGCAAAAVPEDKSEKAVFYHSQDTEGLDQHGEVYLGWAGDASEIIGILSKLGMWVQWEGTKDNKILVKVPDEVKVYV